MVKKTDNRERNLHHHARASSFSSIEIDWASEKQREAFVHPPTPLCCSGGFGAAKTWALCFKALWLSETFPGNRGLIARKVWEDLKNTTLSSFFKICRPEFYNNGGARSDSQKFLRLNNGSEILWAHLDDIETENFIRGIEVNWVLLDQAEEISGEIFEMLMARLGRWDQAEVPHYLIEQHGGEWPWRNPITGKPQVPPYMMLTCNPADFYHWIYRKFHPDSEGHWEKKIPVIDELTGLPKKDEAGQEIYTSYHELGYHMIQMKSWENKFLPQHNLQQMLLKDSAFRKRYVEGEWGITEGTIHRVDPLSVIETDPKSLSDVKVDPDDFLHYVQEHCTLHRVLDHGDSSPTSCTWFAVDREGNIFAYREYYVPNQMVSYHRQQISKLSEFEEYYSNLADPSIFHKVQQKYGGKWSVADEYKDEKMGAKTTIYWRPGDNNEMGTRNRLNEYLRVDPTRIHPITKEKGSPRLFFLKASQDYPNGISHGLRELRAQTRKKIGSDNGKPLYSDDRDDKIPDHAYDNYRYMIASRPAVASVPGRVLDPNSFEAIRREMIKNDYKPERLGYLARKLRRVAVG